MKPRFVTKSCRLCSMNSDTMLGWTSLSLLTCGPGPASFHSARKNYLGRLLDLG